MLESIADKIETFSRKEGEITSFIIYPLLFVVVYEVFMRYAFNSPTTWGFEATTFMYGLHYMFGLTYTDVTNGHVKVDIFTSLLPRKVQAVVSLATNLVLFMPVMICVSIWSVKYAVTSTMGLEVNSTSWGPHIWPLKILMSCCFVFLLMQGVANIIRDINNVKNS
ncbi:MAG: TRAP transporter small permease subunit [Desulfobacteraceae bacterium]